MAECSVNRIGRLQGKAVNAAIDEEPGRIIQQARTGPLERLGESPFSRYYADQASPFNYIFALAHAYACSGKHELIQRHWDTLRRIMDLGSRVWRCRWRRLSRISDTRIERATAQGLEG
jgi:glycogen debranching enzyme